MSIGGRDLRTILRAAVEKRHYVALWNTFKVHKKPINVLSDYLLGHGKYPRKIEVHTRLGEIDLALFSRDDLITVNEIFRRKDYPTEAEDKIIVDFGSNIGISAAYFMTQAPHSYTYTSGLPD
ncbi:MAG TPA: hypothetical protein VHG30_18205 [Microvirga sp.]|nr:hypothetical protein [Microvirga sp.]